MTAAGLCHSDWFVMDLPAENYAYGLPLTLGHEGAGVVDALGDGVTGVAVGDAVAVYGPWGCGLCHACARVRRTTARGRPRSASSLPGWAPRVRWPST
ncbi:alcohol dehydrogenase catalytic domain-containing protein [Geodermatophilus maliterrae]|uniref:Alcohol dehydrogenase catalytic domain-containing protein n=1 Tax=Geodermatophilus maliterrae TaxID=3162531 RepID=A0ABV3XEQ4_9ACTN